MEIYILHIYETTFILLNLPKATTSPRGSESSRVVKNICILTSIPGASFNAISRISSMRSSLGASQNRLEHTIKTLDSSAENVTQTMSKIQDTDIAEQMSEFTKYNILQQSGTSMLSQANQLPQMILKLLEN